MTAGDRGATQQDIFNKNVSEQPVVKYNNPATSGKIQDSLRNRRDPHIHS
ncbi:hypothetical protein [Sporomusa acidovorans]|uniref:Small, acid-soluble spore protein K n=1 Tax=Sporomusa acidovorans (strain ATCC 49682 / DSM 3132 / Mol) TaxID=1123286 RepID=A0ABZ3J8W4_SPOA4|nr:hypothetical protein [Sporomusa acidovorans]OZC16731.1 hypothetical protein SPACI_42020 [Sporomusa acidovorans DSM 3132]SDE04363.1 hypothetical protein SAMN04488499_100720 [Sporomusa acidovorans]